MKLFHSSRYRISGRYVVPCVAKTITGKIGKFVFATSNKSASYLYEMKVWQRILMIFTIAEMSFAIFEGKREVMNEGPNGWIYEMPPTMFRNVTAGGYPTTEWVSTEPVPIDPGCEPTFVNLEIAMRSGCQVFFLERGFTNREFMDAYGITYWNYELLGFLANQVEAGNIIHENRVCALAPVDFGEWQTGWERRRNLVCHSR